MASARRLPSGSYRVNLYIGLDESGKRKYKSFTAPTKKEAELLAAQYNMSRREKPRCELSVREAVENYIESKSNILSPSTVRGYRAILKNDFAKISQIRVCDLDGDTAQKFVNHFAIDHEPKTVRNVYALLASSVEACDPDKRLSVALPKRQKPDIVIPTSDQIKALLASLEGKQEVLCAVMIAAVLGLRRGEICALEWGDLRGGKLIVNKALAHTKDHEWMVKSPKTKSGKRAVTIPKYLEEKLLTLKKEPRQDERIIHLSPNNLTDAFIAARKKLGMSFRFHDLRHYNASVMIYLGVPDVNAMERMGHATPNMLKNVYQHIIEEKKSEQDEKINSFLESAILPDTMQHEMQHEKKEHL